MADPASDWEDDVVVERSDILEYNDANIIPKEQDVIARLRTWLCSTDFDGDGSEYRKHQTSHLPGTCKWLLSSPIYKHWYGCDKHGVLWVRGVPGSGKSVLAAGFIHEKLQEQVPVLYFFFRQIVEANHKPRAALQDWLAQALVYSPPLQLQLRAYLAVSEQEPKKEDSDQRELDSVSTIDLWHHLRTALSHLNRAYIVVDALDEMHQSPATDDFMRHLLGLASWKPAQIKILVTSRPAVSLEQSSSDTDVLCLKLDGGNVDKDIGTYIVSRLASSAIPTELHGAIEAAIPDRAHGLFLHAKLAMDALLREGIDVQTALLDIPQNLDHMYAQLLQDLRTRSGVSLNFQELIMQWVTHAIRPLRLIELSDMLTSDPIFNLPALGAAKHSIRSASGNLIEVLRDETLCVIHHSFTEYLTVDRRLDADIFPKLESGPTHQRLALICLEYLQNGCLEEIELEAPSKGWNPFRQAPSRQLLRPFTRYAALNWNTHVQRSVEHGTSQTEVNNLLDVFTAHAQFQKWAHLVGLRRDSAVVITPVFMATVLGLSTYLRHLLDQTKMNVNEGAPIAWAADQGFTDVVDLLIAYGADVDQYDREGYTALHRATMKNHVGVVRSLLQASGDMRRETNFKRYRQRQFTSIWYACDYGHIEVFTEFQKFMKSRNEVDQALFTAIHSKKAEMVRVLLEHPLVDLNKSVKLSGRQKDMAAKGFVSHATFRNMQPTILDTACSSRDPDMINILLAAGAEVGPYALHAVASSKQATDLASLMQCFSLLIEAGADLHAPGRYNTSNTPLHEAADAIAARALINAGANVEAKNKAHQTPLHTCTGAEVLRTLVEVGNANLEAKDSSGKTVLLAAIHTTSLILLSKDLPAILELIELGANIDAVDEDGNGIFHHAVKGHNGRFLEELTPRLCAAGADINRPNHRGEAPIHLTELVVSKSTTLDSLGKVPRRMTPFEVLAAAGARPDTANVSKTPLFEWVSASLLGAKDADLVETAQALAQCGTSLKVTDDEGKTLLHSAVQERRFTNHRAKIGFLVDQGLDPGASDNEGNTFWHVAATNVVKHQTAELLEFLATLNAEGAITPNQLGQTPLHLLAALMPDSLWELKPSRGGGFESTTPFHILISLHSHVDVADNNGITPLHLVVTFSEYLVQMLLLRGANPSLVTKEGCNAFHLAARSKKPNIIGALLAGTQSATADTRITTLNSKDSFGRTPLYYACLAGCYESSKLLVEAGATVQTTEYENSPWSGVAEIELEATAAVDYSKKTCIGTALMADVSRIPGKKQSYDREVGIEGLITLLLTDPNSRQPIIIDRAVADAARNQADYTVVCLMRARTALQLETSEPLTIQIASSLQRRKDKRESLEKQCVNCERKHKRSPLSRAWAMGDYHHIPEILLSERKLQSLPGIEDGRFVLRSMVSSGLVGPLQLLMASGGPETLSDHLWNSTNVKETSPNFGRNKNRSEVEPLILTACRRVTPNMEVLRFLVEKADHDVNSQQLVKANNSTEPRKFTDTGEEVEGESALHALTRSEHWWHTHEGLPYLLQHGANTEVRDIHGMTPLNAALHRCGGLVFNRKAVELLVQHGADVNAVDGNNDSCLVKSCTDTEMSDLLLKHGAAVTQIVLIRAVDLKNVELLALLLSHTTNTNLSEAPEKQEKRRQPQEYYPLHYITWKMSYRAFERSADDDEIAQKMIRMLLDHGADPCASYGDTTILHELINNQNDIGPLFVTTGRRKNLEVINTAGETPLLAAFSSNSAGRGTRRSPKGQSVINLLLQNGADIRVKDRNGDNIWHRFAAKRNSSQETEDWQSLIQRAPDLINTPNNAGENPLLLAIQDPQRSEKIELLVGNGASLHTTDNNGNNVLHALMNGRWFVEAHGYVHENRLSYFKRFIESDVPINARNKAGETPIFNFFRQDPVVYAPCKCEKAKGQSVYDTFTRAGCDWQIINEKGQNLLHIVAGATPPLNMRAGVSDTSAIFLTLGRMGLDARLEDASGRTALDIAADMGHEKILEYFRENGSDNQADY